LGRSVSEGPFAPKNDDDDDATKYLVKQSFQDLGSLELM
jgi:hypothetical protein